MSVVGSFSSCTCISFCCVLFSVHVHVSCFIHGKQLGLLQASLGRASHIRICLWSVESFFLTHEPSFTYPDLGVFAGQNQQSRQGEPEELLYRDAGVTVLRRGEGRELEVRLVSRRTRPPPPPDEDLLRRRCAKKCFACWRVDTSRANLHINHMRLF